MHSFIRSRFFIFLAFVAICIASAQIVVRAEEPAPASSVEATVEFVLEGDLADFVPFKVVMDAGWESEWTFTADPPTTPPSRTVLFGQHVVSVVPLNQGTTTYVLYVTQNGERITTDMSGSSGVSFYLNPGETVVVHIKAVTIGNLPGAPISLPGEPVGDMCEVTCISDGACTSGYSVTIKGLEAHNANVNLVITSHNGESVGDHSLPPGKYSVTVVPIRPHYPQTFYVKISDAQQSIISNTVVVGSITVDLVAGQTLAVHAEPTIESYNLVFGMFRAVRTALIFNRPYFHMGVTDDLGVAPGEFPNTLITLFVNGKEAIADELAEMVTNAVFTPGNTTVEFRTQHLTLLFAADQDGNLPLDYLLCLTQDDLVNLTDEERDSMKAAFKQELKLAIISWIDQIMAKYHRLSDAAAINALAIQDLGAAYNFIFGQVSEHITKMDAFCRLGKEYCELWNKKVDDNNLNNPKVELQQDSTSNALPDMP